MPAETPQINESHIATAEGRAAFASDFLARKGIQTLPSDEYLTGNRLRLKADELKGTFEPNLSLKERLAIIHHWYAPQLIASGIAAYVNDRTHPLEVLAPPVRETIENLNVGESTFRNRVSANVEAGVYSHLVEHIKDADSLFETYGEIVAKALDNKTGKPVDRKKLKAAFRMRGINVTWVTDWDGTHTNDELIQREEDGLVDPMLPGSRLFDPLHDPLKEGSRFHFKPVFAAGWRPLIANFRELYEEAGATVPFRSGSPELFGFALANGLNPVIDSTNFDPFIYASLEALANASSVPFDPEGVRICGVNLNPFTGLNAAFKGDVLFDATDGKSIIIYTGDSHSDLPTFYARSIMALAMGYDNGKYILELNEEAKKDPSLLVIPFHDGRDIQETFQTIFSYRDFIDGILAGPRRQAAVA